MSDHVTVALVGNPNCGKTTLFNALTGSRQRVGNWPGVTVERIDGQYHHEAAEVHVVDLPGIYSFSAYSIDETIAREYILTQKPAVVVNIIDATNLERNLFLTTQLLEMKVPVVVALNMTDLAKQRGLRIEVEHLAKHLDCPVVPLVASKKTGVAELREAIAEAAARRAISATNVKYDSEVEKAIDALRLKVTPLAEDNSIDARWLAIKLLEQDEQAVELTAGLHAELVAAETQRIEKHIGEDIDIVIADGRYGFIHGLSRDVLHHTRHVRRTVSDAIDKIVLNRVLGIPVFLGVMYLVFAVTISVGAPFIEFFDGVCETIFVDGFGALLEHLHCPAFLTTLLAGGVGGGIQTVATFIPPIFFIFLCLSVLEDSGYMARAAFVMDRLLRSVGLPGKAFLPMLVGFGCNVPAIMATRTLENRRDRIMTVLMNPFMSCAARLPVYTLFAAVFFPRGAGVLVFSLYLTGIVLGILTGLLLKSTVLRGEASTFVMELPPYHLPTVGGVLYHTWNKLKSFLLRAGKVIMIVVIILSVLNAVGTDGSFGHKDSSSSVLSAIGRGLTPVFTPMGIEQENWPATVGLFTGIFAKEAVVGTLESLYRQSDREQQAASSQQAGPDEPFDFWGGIKGALEATAAGFEGLLDNVVDPLGVMAATATAKDKAQAAEELEVSEGTLVEMAKRFGSKPAAIAYVLFILIYAPCVAAIAAIYRETNLKWMIFSVLYLTSLAWVVSTVFYQAATFVEHPVSSGIYIGACAAALVAFYVGMKIRGRHMRPL